MVGNGATFEIQKNDFPKNDILRAKMAIFHKVTDMTGTQKKEQKQVSFPKHIPKQESLTQTAKHIRTIG